LAESASGHSRSAIRGGEKTGDGRKVNALMVEKGIRFNFVTTKDRSGRKKSWRKRGDQPLNVRLLDGRGGVADIVAGAFNWSRIDAG